MHFHRLENVINCLGFVVTQNKECFCELLGSVADLLHCFAFWDVFLVSQHAQISKTVERHCYLVVWFV